MCKYLVRVTKNNHQINVYYIIGQKIGLHEIKLRDCRASRGCDQLRGTGC
jgi:hypothetical protein